MELKEIIKIREDNKMNIILCESNDEHNIGDNFQIGESIYQISMVNYSNYTQKFQYRLLKKGHDQYRFNYSISEIVNSSIVKIED